MKNRLTGHLAEVYKKWQPHAVQKTILQAVMSEKYNDIFISMARKAGKTETIIALTWTYALSKPGSVVFYVTPSRNDGLRILWHNQRLQNFGPSDAIERIDETNNIIYFKNGSMIMLIGSGRHSSASGLTPNLVIYDEYSEFNPNFHIEMAPNRAVHNCPILYVGTLPLVDSRNRDQYLDIMEKVKNDPQGLFASYPSWVNPHVSREFLKKTKKDLFNSKQDYLWYLQYESKYVVGGKNAIFQDFDPKTHCKSREDIQALMKSGDYSRWRFVLATSSDQVKNFGAILLAIDTNTHDYIVLDEVVLQDHELLKASHIYKCITEMINRWTYLNRVHIVGSFNEEWLQIELMGMYGVNVSCNSKYIPRISTAKSLFSKRKMISNEECQNFINEIQFFVLNSNGKATNNQDILIKCLFNFINNEVWDLKEIFEDNPMIKDEKTGLLGHEMPLEFDEQSLDMLWADGEW